MLEILKDGIRICERRMNLLTTLLTEVEKLAASGQFVEISSRPIAQEREESIGVVIDPHLRALVTAVIQHKKKAETVLGLELSPEERTQIDEDLCLLNVLMWEELRASFGEKAAIGSVSLRAGWNFVLVKGGLVYSFPFPEGPIEVVILDDIDCGDPNCPVHHPVPPEMAN
jgi:hypothetical protein